MASPTETKIDTRTINGHEVEVWRNAWDDGAVTYSIMHGDEQVSGEDWNYVPSNDEIAKHLPGFICVLCGDEVSDPLRHRSHLEDHNPGASHISGEEIAAFFELTTEGASNGRV
jgi:hypothetical protein